MSSAPQSTHFVETVECGEDVGAHAEASPYRVGKELEGDRKPIAWVAIMVGASAWGVECV